MESHGEHLLGRLAAGAGASCLVSCPRRPSDIILLYTSTSDKTASHWTTMILDPAQTCSGCTNHKICPVCVTEYAFVCKESQKYVFRTLVPWIFDVLRLILKLQQIPNTKHKTYTDRPHEQENILSQECMPPSKSMSGRFLLWRTLRGCCCCFLYSNIRSTWNMFSWLRTDIHLPASKLCHTRSIPFWKMPLILLCRTHYCWVFTGWNIWILIKAVRYHDTGIFFTPPTISPPSLSL